jgi:hypothetical protein
MSELLFWKNEETESSMSLCARGYCMTKSKVVTLVLSYRFYYFSLKLEYIIIKLFVWRAFTIGRLFQSVTENIDHKKQLWAEKRQPFIKDVVDGLNGVFGKLDLPLYQWQKLRKSIKVSTMTILRISIFIPSSMQLYPDEHC